MTLVLPAFFLLVIAVVCRIAGPNGDSLLADRITREVYGLGSLERRAWQHEAFLEYRKKLKVVGGRMNFLLHAGVGSGKTLWSAMISGYMLNKDEADFIVFVCPSRSIRSKVMSEYRKANIHLAKWNRGRELNGRPIGINGYAMTYQVALRDEDLIGRLCDSTKTLVIFDEIHHLGQDKSWCDAAERAFKGRACYVLGLTGTPFRSDMARIPFVEYVEAPDKPGTLISKPDFTYPLGRAIIEEHCRKPVTHWLGANVRVKFPDGHIEKVDMSTELDPPMMNRRLNGAVRPGSKSRAMALSRVLSECRRRKDRLIIFVGGDSRSAHGGGKKDAAELLPKELADLGVMPHEIAIVTSDDVTAQHTIDNFADSPAWILISVDMVSEGTDIPVLNAALFLTSITARQKTIQRIGRVLRGKGEAHIYMFDDPRYRDIMESIETEYRHEIEMGKHAVQSEPVPGTANPDRDYPPPSIGIDCSPAGITTGSVHYTQEELGLCLRYIADKMLPEGSVFLSSLLPLARDGMLDKYKS